MRILTLRAIGLVTCITAGAASPGIAQTFTIDDARDSGNSHRNYPPSKAVDGDTAFSSRWAANYGNGSATLYVDLGEAQTIDDIGVAWGRGDERSYTFNVRARAGTKGSWTRIFSGQSSGDTTQIEQYNVNDISARQIRIQVFSNSAGTDWANITEFEVYGTSGPDQRATTEAPIVTSNTIVNTSINEAPIVTSNTIANTGITEAHTVTLNTSVGEFGLDPNAEPWDNFDLTKWSLDTPAPRPDDGCRAERTWDHSWRTNDPLNESSQPFFFTHTDGGMRFVTRVGGQTTSTSCNSGYVRSELREMLRFGDRDIDDTGVSKNNWKLGYQPGNNSDWGGVNGQLDTTMRVNRVTTTGSSGQVGRVIIGQIHAGNDEPLRLYYRKRVGQDKGCIFFAHEIRDDDDIRFTMIGDTSCTSAPSDGIALDELFSYTIINDDKDITVIIRRGDKDGPVIASKTIDMDELNSGYDRSDEWMYFKAGAYTQNDTGDDNDGDIVTIYRLSTSHD